MQRTSEHIDIELAALRTLSYFDLFHYPLTATEILFFLPIKSSEEAIREVLNTLVRHELIFAKNHFYALASDNELFERRVRGNDLAKKLYPDIRDTARLIEKFPFVRSVLASGSFSKNYMDGDSDFDFFIICAPNRVWISRMLLVMYKRLFLKNSHKRFCINYFVDEKNLQIQEQNVFTATELITVVPLTDHRSYQELLHANNKWIRDFFPNFTRRKTDLQARGSVIKNLVEPVVNLLFADALNRLFKNITLWHWRKIYRKSYSKDEFDLAFKSTDGVSKNHPRNYQNKIVAAYQQKVSELTRKIEAA